jgi:hypothetical protein
MRYRSTGATLVALAVAVMGSGTALAETGGPAIERGRVEERFFDDFIFELCGIETFTTLTQHFSAKTFADGSEWVHVVRTFVSDDPRLPVEKGAATTFVAPDGTRTVVGKPIQLFAPDGGVRLLDAGWVQLLDEPVFRGPHPSVEADDLAPYYCPPGT